MFIAVLLVYSHFKIYRAMS